jgi:translation initiation factor IF-2
MLARVFIRLKKYQFIITMDEEKKQQRLANLAKARQKIMELREQSKNISRKTKDEERFKDEIKKVSDTIETMEKTTPEVVDKTDTKDDVKEPVVKQEPVVEKKEEPVVQKREEPIVKEKKPKKVYVKKPKPEPIVIEEKPVKLTFQRGADGLWYM